MDTPKKMIQRREREKGIRRDIEREGEIREREREVNGIKREDREEEKISTSIPRKISRTAIW